MKKLLFMTLMSAFLLASCEKDDVQHFGDLFGIVANESGDKLDSTIVYLLKNDSIYAIDTTNHDGEFLYKLLPVGSYKLASFNKTLKKSDTISVEVLGDLQNEVLFIFKAKLSIQGSLIGYFNKLLAGCTVYLVHSDALVEGLDYKKLESTVTDQNGQFRFYNLEQGFYIPLYITTAGRDIYNLVNIREDITYKVALQLGHSGYFTDQRDGHKYPCVKVGEQTWMAENLAYLPKVDNLSDGSEDNGYTSGIYYYINQFYPNSDISEEAQILSGKQTDNYKNFGVLYSWPAAMNGSNPSSSNPSNIQGACPDGWHLPSISEVNELRNFINDDVDYNQPGKLLKAKGYLQNSTGLWEYYNEEVLGIDEYHLSFVPGGYRTYNGSYYYSPNYMGYFWTTDQPWYSLYAYFYYLGYYGTFFNNSSSYKSYGFSVRCIKDE